MTVHPSSPELIETSFADAIAAIDAATDLSPDKRRHWACSLRRIAKALDKPLVMIPARWTSVRFPIARLHHADHDLTAKSLANHKANVKAALAWLAGTYNLPTRGAPLTAPWQVLRDGLNDRRRRANLSSLMRFCSARGVAPEFVDEAVVDALMDYRAKTTALATDGMARRQIARAWNACIGDAPGWPSLRLVEPEPLRPDCGPDWEAFPEGLRRDVDAYLKLLTGFRRGASGKRWKPCRPGTIVQRRRDIVTAARRAVRLGVPIENLTSLAALLAPETARKIVDDYWAENGETPAVYVIGLSGLFLDLARKTGCLGEEDIAELADINAVLEEHRPVGMTPKNRALIRKIYHSDVWARVVALPEALMVKARRLHNQAPMKAALLAQVAVAIAILTYAPVRLANLGGIRIGTHLQRRATDGRYLLSFPEHQVKNRTPLEYWLNPDVSALIAEYMHVFRLICARGFDTDALFPGMKGNVKGLSALSAQITRRVFEATGLRVTVHQFRHAAGAVILKSQPGNYELVRLLLGHKNIATTIRFYAELDSIAASEQFADMVKAHGRFDDSDAEREFV